MGPDKEQQIDIRDYINVIRKRKWTLVAVFVVIVTTVILHSFTATPIYEATTLLVIEKENPNVVSVQEVMAVDASGTDYYQTQYKIIESRTVARDVISRLNLERSKEFFPEPKNDFVSKIKQSVRVYITFLKNSIVSLLNTGDKNATEDLKESKEESNLVSRFIERIEVTPIRNSRLVDVSYRARAPVTAARIVNTLADAYIDQNLETRLKAVQDAVKWLHERIEEERKKVERAENGLLEYKEKYNIVTDFSSDTEKITAQKLAHLNSQVVEAESRRVEAETRYKQAIALRDSPDMLDSIPEVINNELIRQINSMEVELYKRISELSKKYGEKHPRMVAIKSELDTLRKRKTQEVNRVINSLRNEYKVALAREKSLKDALAKQKNECMVLNQKAIRYGVLKREAESARHMYDLLINRFKETTLTEDMKTGNIRVIDRAEAPRAPVKPNKKLNILLAVIVGLVTGTGLAFFFEYLDNTIKTPEDVKQQLGLPYLGPTPVFDSGEEERPELVTLHSPKSTASESYRGIRTGILFSSAESPPGTILVTSAGPQEGKTITTANLGITMAQAGARTIILDCDMRRPSLHKIFGIKKDRGISNILVGSGDLGKAVHHTGVENLDIIPCGPVPPNPSEILGSNRMTSILETLRTRYSYIFIDAPPSTAVTDAVVLSRSAEGVIFVIRAGETPREIARNALSQFEAVKAHIIGIILNGVDMGRDGYYYYQHYYYYYGEDGKKAKRYRRKKRPKSRYYD